jgi:hypothetical protein
LLRRRSGGFGLNVPTRALVTIRCCARVSAFVGAAVVADGNAGGIGGEGEPRRVPVGDVGADEVVACEDPQVEFGLRGVPNSCGDHGDGVPGICGGGTTSSERSGRHGS